MKILIVEDNEESRNLLTKQLRVHGHEITATANGAEALGQAMIQPPDIIISDIMMPGVDGFKLCHQCKQNEQLKDIPFVFYTATYKSDEDEKFGLSLGANAYLTKPMEPDALVLVLTEIYEKAKSGTLSPADGILLEPSLFLNEYSKRIVAKLEEEVANLETEIIARKRAEEEIKQTAEQWMITFDSITDMVSIQDKDFKIVRVNKAYADTFKKTREELVGKLCYEVFHETEKMPPNCPYFRTLQTKEAHVEEYYEPRIGTHLEVATSPIFNGGGEVIASVRVARNITKRKDMEQNLEQRVRETTALNNLFAKYLNQGFEAAETYGRHASKIMKEAEEIRSLLNQGSGSVETCVRLVSDIMKMAEEVQALAREAEARRVHTQPAEKGEPGR